jgi:hypothetical protein
MMRYSAFLICCYYWFCDVHFHLWCASLGCHNIDTILARSANVCHSSCELIFPIFCFLLIIIQALYFMFFCCCICCCIVSMSNIWIMYTWLYCVINILSIVIDKTFIDSFCEMMLMMAKRWLRFSVQSSVHITWLNFIDFGLVFHLFCK